MGGYGMELDTPKKDGVHLPRLITSSIAIFLKLLLSAAATLSPVFHGICIAVDPGFQSFQVSDRT
jgi:hypothetical protein